MFSNASVNHRECLLSIINSQLYPILKSKKSFLFHFLHRPSLNLHQYISQSHHSQSMPNSKSEKKNLSPISPLRQNTQSLPDHHCQVVRRRSRKLAASETPDNDSAYHCRLKPPSSSDILLHKPVVLRTISLSSYATPGISDIPRLVLATTRQ